ncbi:hypothetical protein PoB_005805300 [Plakobranchus ocellatus]|uniref:Uncharacterized protein n=1 Tax=Plakobranchus ocellatus TaxID=259542 RepID=A0AAV4CIV9_9GAST|nr:hypothetical protein PoB_005805300 [Plakobranchus ocellatus]
MQRSASTFASLFNFKVPRQGSIQDTVGKHLRLQLAEAFIECWMPMCSVKIGPRYVRRPTQEEEAQLQKRLFRAMGRHPRAISDIILGDSYAAIPSGNGYSRHLQHPMAMQRGILTIPMSLQEM